MTPVDYYRQYIHKNPLYRAAEWERLIGEECWTNRELPQLYKDMMEAEQRLAKETKEKILFEELIPRVHGYVVKTWKGRRAYRGY